MELSLIRSTTAFRANERKDDTNHTTTPIPKATTATDVFILGAKVASKPVTGIFGRIANKVKNVSTKISETVNSSENQQKINVAKLTKLFISNDSMSMFDINKNKEFINELAKQDYDKVEKKYNTIIAHTKKEFPDYKTNSFRYKSEIELNKIGKALAYEKLEAQDIDEIYSIKENRPPDENPNIRNTLDVYALISTLEQYEHFDELPASTQKNIMDYNKYNFPTSSTLTVEEVKSVQKNSSLMKFDYIKDLQSVNSKEEFVKKMDVRRKNIHSKPIPVSEKYFETEDIKNLSNALKNTDLTKYKKGFTLDYSRADFIKDFNDLTNNLSNEDKKKVFDHFQFKINTGNDIINYPNPNTDADVESSIKDVVAKGQELVNRFMLENKVTLAPEDKALETELNKIIKAFPEFISVIGKIQHRGDSIDFHTIDDMKRILSAPEFATLQKSEQKILITATLFHDFGKVQGEVDNGHERKSAILAKEIIKKTDFSLDEKERIFNLINHSHWLVNEPSIEDIAFNFRRPNDFKMAEIFEKADSNSAGFEYNPNANIIEEIKKNIQTINSTGNLLFANSLPKEDKYYDKTASGVRYLDLRDPEMSVEKYGYPAGTKVKDLRFLCHSSNDNRADFETLCDDSKEVCLSTTLLDYRKRFSTGYNNEGAYILGCGSNSNIVLGGKDVACTGGHRGYNYYKNTVYHRDTEGIRSNVKNMREIIPNQIKSDLNLSDEEYTELYTQISNIEKLEDIPDVALESGRKIKASEIQKVIKDMQTELVEPREKGDRRYTNEIVIYNPKLEAEVTIRTPEELETMAYTDRTYVIV